VPPELRGDLVNTSLSKEDSPEVTMEKSHLLSGDAMNEILSQSKGIQSTEIEKKHVYEVYDEIAMHWHHTRGKRKVYWNRVKLFLESLPRGSLVAGLNPSASVSY
jgi:alkylated DNA repair protein alkB homolog 8